MIHKTRKTKETEIDLKLDVDGSQNITIDTGHAFFDHMLHQLAWHAGWDMDLKAKGDLEVDAHHTVEDVGIVIGTAVAQALGDKAGITRVGSASVPLDET